MNAVEFLEQLVCPPEQKSVKMAVEELTELELLDENENLTSLGRTVADFQLTPKLSKAMVNAVVFKCVTPVIDIATIFSAESELFSTGLVDKAHVKDTKTDFSKTSDHLAFMRLFEKWLEYSQLDNQYIVQDFCAQTGLVPHKMRTLDSK